MTGDDSELSVLVVDDDAAILRTLLLTLKNLGCRAVGESGGEAALAEVEEAQIRKVLGLGVSMDKAAALLGITTVTLWRKRKELGLD